MLNLKCKIKIENKDNKNIEFDYVHSIEVKTSISNLTDTATIKLPLKMQKEGKLLADSIDIKDPITIQMGYEEYDPENIVFTGYITGKKTDINSNTSLLVLSCENEMYRLKLNEDVDPENFENFNIKDFFERYVTKKNPNVTCEPIGNPFFGCMNFEKKMTMAQALDAVKKKYSYIKCYFQDDVLHVIEEEELTKQNKKPIVFDPSCNMVSDKLEYKSDMKTCLKAVSIRSDCKKWEVFVPPDAVEQKDGKTVVKNGFELQTKHCPGFEEEADLQEYAKKTVGTLIASRMTGTFTAFGVPFVRKGDFVELRNELQKERHKTRFVVEAVDYNFGALAKDSGGYRQTITLGRQLITEEKKVQEPIQNENNE